ncbi:MAG: nucleotidyltransferase family protein [Myxococcota bacterium]
MKNKKPKNATEIINILKLHITELKKRFKVKEIGVFGSYVRGEQKREGDIDILVEFEDGYKTFDNYIEIKFYLEEILESDIDLVLKIFIREELRQTILSDGNYA